MKKLFGPRAPSKAASTQEHSAVVIDVLGDDENWVSIASVADGMLGTAEITEDGYISYTPRPDALGKDKLVYDIVNASGRKATAVMRVSVEAESATDASDGKDGAAVRQTVVIDAISVRKIEDHGTSGGEPTPAAQGQSGPDAGYDALTETAHDDFFGADTLVYTFADGGDSASS